MNTKSGQENSRPESSTIIPFLLQKKEVVQGAVIISALSNSSESHTYIGDTGGVADYESD